MSCCYTYYTSERNYLRSPIGCLKCLNIILGAASLVLLTFTFSPSAEDRFCLAVTIFSLTCSAVYFLLYLCYPELRYFRFNRRLDNAFHLLSGFLLILAGIDLGQLIGSPGKFSGVHFVNPGDEPCFGPGYVKGAAKIFTFINGVLYAIVGFIRVKGDEDSTFDYDYDIEHNGIGSQSHSSSGSGDEEERQRLVACH